ncbi:MAG: zinc-ribbon domain-containing protein [Firmicutes bacterium]|nr:zinc-ribbon domain-containing protein [Bacillota bacterium]
MALIHCPECGKEISDKSTCCIHCGYPLKEEELEARNVFETTAPDVTDDNEEEDNDEEEDTPPVLTQCPVCGKTVSSSAYECPECGHPLKEKEGGISFGLVLLAVILGIVICAFF